MRPAVGRKFAFSFVFLLLLPFFISLPPMLFWRISQGHWQGTLGLVVLAVAFTFIMFLLLIELMHSLMARIEIGDTSVKMTLPSGRGPTPIVRYRRHDIPYDQIKAVETRREIYGGSVAPVLLQGARLILKDDSAGEARLRQRGQQRPVLPYPEIAQKIAERAGIAGAAPRQRAPLGAEEILRAQAAAFSAEAEGTVERVADRGAQQEPPPLGDAAHQPACRSGRARHRARHHLPAEQRPAAGADQPHEAGDRGQRDEHARSEGAGAEEVNPSS